MDMNVVDLILSDHRELKHLFQEAQANPTARSTIVPTMVNLLTAHSRAEEAEVYPVAVEAGIESVQHSQQEHLEADELAAAVAAADPMSPGFDEKLQKLIDGVLHHMKEEETDVLPAIADSFPPDRLAELAERFAAARERHLGAMPADITRSELAQQARNAGVEVGDRSKKELKDALKSAAEE